MLTVLLISAAIALVLLYHGKGLLAWLLGLAALLYGTHAPVEAWVVLGVLGVIFGVPPVRRLLISGVAMRIAKGVLPTIGETERIALEAGTVWWEGDLFSGKPNWKKLRDFKIQPLTKEEQDFLDGPTAELCNMIDDWDISQRHDLPPKVWKFMKEQKFFGMVIPKKFGGLGFSARMHSEVVTRLTGRSIAGAVTVMVPNSLGPGELLLHYGTKKQKEHYLPRLADGREIPCFGLTEPHAGSDAANGRSLGVVCKEEWNGKKTLGVKLTFEKRYITLAPVATVVGLAFHLKDPDGLLGDDVKEGITLALIPRETAGMQLGERHDPIGIAFMNGTIKGKDVFIPLDHLIGGKEYIGHGWRMLMEALSAGRGISLPSLAVGGTQFCTRVSTAYTTVRQQFGLPINRFEGIRERMARMAASSYYLTATRNLTCGAIDDGAKPSVVSAIAKAYLTADLRTAAADAMDILGGAGICRGPRNVMARPYMSVPIAITVEGANILTRSLIVFGQGAIRCHPFLQAEVDAIAAGDVKAFDRAMFGHINHFARNSVRSLVLGLTDGRLVGTPPSIYKRHYQRLSRFSAALATVADVGFIFLGGKLKRMEYLSGRYADALAWLFLASATLKRAEEEKMPQMRPLVEWSMTHAYNQLETALNELLRNMPLPGIKTLFHLLVLPTGRRCQPPTDVQHEAVMKVLLDAKGPVRDALTTDVAIPTNTKLGLGAMEDTLGKVYDAAPAQAKLKKALRAGELEPANDPLALHKAAAAKNIINKDEWKLLDAAYKAIDNVVQVDAFPHDGVGS